MIVSVEKTLVCEINNVFVEPVGATTVRLLIVKVPGKLPAVVASIETVLELKFPMTVAAALIPGELPRNQLLVASHFPLAEVLHPLPGAGTEFASLGFVAVWYSSMFVKPSLSGSPLAPSLPTAESAPSP